MAREAGGDPSSPTTYNLLFVCTGNTCRSPMAEAVARREIARRGWKHVAVRSAGVAAQPGHRATEAAVAAVRDIGIDLSEHRSRVLDADLIDWADVILAMSPSHLAVVDELGGAAKAALLTDFASGEEGSGHSVPDPFGGDEDTYRTTLAELDKLVARSLDRLSPIVTP